MANSHFEWTSADIIKYKEEQRARRESNLAKATQTLKDAGVPFTIGNDRCPSCNREIEPYHSDELEPEAEASQLV